MTKLTGRPPGRVLHAKAFEALLAARNLLKKDVCADAQVSPQFLADLLAGRGGASVDVSQRLADTLSVPLGCLFPEVDGWTSPLPDRSARRGTAAA